MVSISLLLHHHSSREAFGAHATKARSSCHLQNISSAEWAASYFITPSTFPVLPQHTREAATAATLQLENTVYYKSSPKHLTRFFLFVIQVDKEYNYKIITWANTMRRKLGFLPGVNPKAPKLRKKSISCSLKNYWLKCTLYQFGLSAAVSKGAIRCCGSQYQNACSRMWW